MSRIVATGSLLVACALLLGGCASGAKPEEMVVQKAVVSHGSSSTVMVAVSGGSETSAMGASQISDEAFAQALRDSITRTGLFKQVTADAARYKLTAFIGKVDQPMIGFSLTVRMEVTYRLTDMQSGKTIWTRDIASEHTSTTGDAFVGATRLRLANEGAAKANIEQAIREMSSLQL